MIIASKYLPLILFTFSDTAAKDPTFGGLRGQNHRSPGNGNGIGLGKLKKLNAEGCTVLEKVNVCFPLTSDDVAHECDNETREFACEEVSTGQIYSIEDDLIEISNSNKPNQANGNKPGLLDFDEDVDVLESAQTLFVGDADIDGARGIIKFNQGRFGKKPNKGKGKGRALQSVGSPKVLALNVVSGEGITTGYNNTHLADSVFGSLVGGPDLVNLASQATACSHGQLNFAPLNKASGNASVVGDVSDGVATVYSTVSTASGQGAIREDATSKLKAAHGSKGGADYVMVCLPEGKMGTAYAFIGHWLSVYPSGMCTNPSIQLHEIGHNLRLGHSGELGAYDDKSGVMGSGGGGDERSTCFNGCKNWQLGWFSDRHVNLTPFVDSFSGRLFGTTQYDVTTSSDKMILRLHDPGCSICDYYVSFNHASSYNAFTGESKDMVQIHTKAGTPDSGKASKVVARLGAGGAYTATVNGANMTVAVSSVNADEGWAEIIVAPGASAAPTTAHPTKAPSASPTAAPTASEPSAAPTTAPPTPAPETGSFYIACGSSAMPCSGRSRPADVDESHELRCCADSEIPGFFRHEACDLEVWSESQFEGTCYHGVTWNEGVSICATHRARLCTEDEILADCARGSGCSHDGDMIWSSTKVETLAPTSQPTPAPSQHPTASPSAGPTMDPTGSPSTSPSLSPTSNPTAGPTSSPSASPSKQPTGAPIQSLTASPAQAHLGFLHKVVCGSTNGYCHNSPVLVANADEIHAVRCCSETAKEGWAKQSQCDVWGESHLPTCNAASTYSEAEVICAANDARLCTESELLDDCAHGSGCGFNDVRVWSSSTVPMCADDASCDDGLVCTTDTCGADGKCVNEAIGCGKMVACGSTANECTAPYVKGADPSELHEVRCCSDVAKSGWVQEASCAEALGRDVWGQSNGSLGTCNAAKTYAEAEVICLAGDARLCTVEEVRADCTRGSGCQFDWENVWTSDNVATAAGELFN
ncbi:hypothetical protein ACHAWF_011924 [Thalassiosira exigua]